MDSIEYSSKQNGGEGELEGERLTKIDAELVAAPWRQSA